jgi:hypothetical protein
MRLGCPEFNTAAMQAILQRSPGIIILAGRWDAFVTGELLISENSVRPSHADSLSAFASTFRNTILTLTRAGHRVIIIGQVPLPDGNSIDCFERRFMTGRDASECAATRASRAELESSVVQLLQSGVGTASNVRMIFPFEKLCDAERCPIFAGNSDFAYMDKSHLSAAGAELLSADIEASVTRLRSRRTAAVR